MILRRVPSLRLAPFSRASRAYGRAFAWLALSQAFLIWSDVGSGILCVCPKVWRNGLLPNEGGNQAHNEDNGNQGEAIDSRTLGVVLLLSGKHSSL